MAIFLNSLVRRDPDGYRDGLRLKGDWIFFCLTNAVEWGFGEASHSGDDQACIEKAKSFFNDFLKDLEPSLENFHKLEETAFKSPKNFIEATAISGLNQALYDLLARQKNKPVWKLFVDEPIKTTLPLYITINRALSDRTLNSYLNAVNTAKVIGLDQVKCAPFTSVHKEDDAETQLKAAENGLKILKEMRRNFPGIGLRIDFHSRFHLKSFLKILPELESLELEWIEEPCQNTSDFLEIRRSTQIPLAAGELFFGTKGFSRLIHEDAVDIIMPDVKHVGGFGPLINVCRLAEKHGVQVSPHNPSGVISTLASLQSAAVSSSVTSLEVPLLFSGKIPLEMNQIEDGRAKIPLVPGWGFSNTDIKRLKI